MLLEFDGTFIFATLSFIVFVLIMNVILYRPITKIMEERQKFYDKNKSTVLESKRKAEEVLENKEKEILDAKLKASDILQTTQNKIKENRENTLKNKKEEVLAKIKSNNAALDNDKKQAKEDIKKEVETYVKMTVSKVLDSEIQDINIDSSLLQNAMEGER